MPVELVKPGTHIDFLGKWRTATALSLAIIVAGLVAIPLRGFRLGIDFAGGTEVQVRFVDAPDVDEGAVRSVVRGLGISGDVVRYGEAGEPEFLIKFQGEREIALVEASERSPVAEESAAGAGEAPDSGAKEDEDTPDGEAAAGSAATREARGAVTARTDRILALQEALEGEIGKLSVERVEFVGPKVGAELRDDGLAAMGIACLLILGYIAFRFSPRFAPGAVVALVHDVLMTSSLWVLMGLEFDLKVLAALLAIIGYSLNDTIIVYDRIRENMELRTKHDLFELLNRSVNQTLSRTLLTSLTTLGAVLALLLLGGSVIRPFALAMAIGVAIGTYSSVFIAAPTLLLLESRFGDAPPPTPPVKGPPRTKKKARSGKPARA